MTTTEITSVGHDRSADANTIIGWLRSSKTVIREQDEWAEFASEVAAAFQDDIHLRDLVLVRILKDDDSLIFLPYVELCRASHGCPLMLSVAAACFYTWGYPDEAVSIAARATEAKLCALIVLMAGNGVPPQAFRDELLSDAFEQAILASGVTA